MTGRRTFGPGPHTLCCNGRPIAPVAVADSAASRRKGLLGTDEVQGALWITRCPSVHMVGMRYPIDVAAVDAAGRVLLVATLRPWVGATRLRLRAKATVEAPAGAMQEWGVTKGSVLRVERASERASEPAPHGGPA